MALVILDGNQSATTLSTIVVSSAHIPAHTVVSLGTQAKTDILSAVSSGIAISGTVTANVFGQDSNDYTNVKIPVCSYDVPIESATSPYVVPVQISSTNGSVGSSNPLPISGTVTANLGSALPTGTNRIGVVTIGAGTVTLGASTSQIGSVTASISNFPATQPVSIASVTIGNTVAISGTVTSNLGLMQSVVATEGLTASGTFVKIGGHTGTSTTGNIAHVSAVGAIRVDGSNYTQPISGTVTIGNFPATQAISIASVTIGNSLTISSLPAISGTVTANAPSYNLNFTTVTAFNFASSGDSPVFEISGIQAGQVFAFDGRFHGSTDNVYSLQAGTIINGSLSGAVTVSTIDADTFISATTFGLISGKLLAQQNISKSSYQFKKLSGTAGSSITAGVSLVNIPNYGFERNTPISGTVTANTFAVQGTAVTTSNFTSTTASTVLASFNATREVLTIFNEGAGNLHICAGATCTTIAYQVRLSAGDYYEVPNHQTTITHSAVFATAGTARVTQVS